MRAGVGRCRGRDRSLRGDAQPARGAAAPPGSGARARAAARARGRHLRADRRQRPAVARDRGARARADGEARRSLCRALGGLRGRSQAAPCERARRGRRARREDARGGRPSGCPLRRHAGARDLLLRPDPHGHHRREARARLGGGRRLGLSLGAELPARLPGRGPRLRAHHPALRGRARGARAARDSRALGDRLRDPGGLAAHARTRPALAPPHGQDGVRRPLRKALRVIEPEHLTQLRETLRRFVADEMPPEKRRAWDRAHQFPRDAFARLAALVVCGLTVDPEYGGQGRALVVAVAVIEELCRGCSFLAGPFIHCAFYAGINLSLSGSEAQRRELLPRVARGELCFAYGLSEPDVGGDLASVRTRARRTADGGVVVSGSKRWCPGADFANFLLCLARSDESAPRHRNLSFVLVPSGAPGVHVAPIEHANLRYTLSSDVSLDEVRVPIENVLGGAAGWNQGWAQLVGGALDCEKLEISAVSFGIAQAAVEEAWRYAQERHQFGRPIGAHQAVRHALVDARTKLEACRHLLAHAAWLANEGRPCAVETSMAKLFVAETAVEIALICQRVMGAYGLCEGDMERHVRDLLGMPIVGGSSNMQRNNLAARLGLAS